MECEDAMAESFNQLAIDPREWDDFVLSVRGDIYMTFDWCQSWWRYYGQGRTLRVFIFREGGRLVGLAPMFVERIRLGAVSLRLAKRVGADHALTIFSLPIARERAQTIYSYVISKLIKVDRCDAVWIGPCPADDPTIPALLNAAAELHGVASGVRVRPGGPHTVINLPTNFDDYLKSLDSRQRQYYRRRLKLLGNSHKVEKYVVRDPLRANEAFAEFRSAHGRQWASEGKLGHFGDWPRADEFNEELVRVMSKSGRFRLLRLKADNEVIAYEYAFVFGDRCFWRLPARTMKQEFQQFRVGILGLVQLIETMIGDGVCSIEAGVGHYEYKLHFGGRELTVQSYIVLADRPFVTIRFAVFSYLSVIIDFLYNRLWFRRVVKHFPFLRRPLWRTWIRSRLG